jgi:hypothetical protein
MYACDQRAYQNGLDMPASPTKEAICRSVASLPRHRSHTSTARTEGYQTNQKLC